VEESHKTNGGEEKAFGRKGYCGVINNILLANLSPRGAWAIKELNLALQGNIL
jgi:hypothetical protein